MDFTEIEKAYAMGRAYAMGLKHAKLMAKLNSVAQDEDGFVTLTDKKGNSYVAQTNKEERERYETSGKKLSEVKKEEKKGAKKKPEKTTERGKKLTKEEIDTYYEKSTLNDMVNLFSTKNGSPDMTLTDNDSLSIWYRDGEFKNFNGENEPEEISKAINKKGIKAITLESEWGMSYYGKDNEIFMRKADTDEIKTMTELKKEGIYEHDPWLVDDVR